MSRKTITTGSPWEPKVGYSRAVRIDNHIFVAGTTSTTPSGKLVGKDDAYAQTKQILRNVESALSAAGAAMTDVVRTRMYVTNIDNWEDIAKAHREVFGEILPAATMVEVSRLINPDMLIEIEVDALVST